MIRCPSQFPAWAITLFPTASKGVDQAALRRRIESEDFGFPVKGL